MRYSILFQENESIKHCHTFPLFCVKISGSFRFDLGLAPNFKFRAAAHCSKLLTKQSIWDQRRITVDIIYLFFYDIRIYFHSCYNFPRYKNRSNVDWYLLKRSQRSMFFACITPCNRWFRMSENGVMCLNILFCEHTNTYVSYEDKIQMPTY